MSFSSITRVISTGRRLSLVPSHGILISAEDEDHHLSFMRVEDEYYVEIAHEMSKTHYISFILALRDDGWEIKKLYPEGSAGARFKIRGTRSFLYYCNRHGLYRVPVR